MELTLTPEIKAAVGRLMKSGRYASEVDALATAVKLLEEEERAFAELRQKVREGVEAADQGDLIDGEDVFADLKRRHDDEFGVRRWRV